MEVGVEPDPPVGIPAFAELPGGGDQELMRLPEILGGQRRLGVPRPFHQHPPAQRHNVQLFPVRLVLREPKLTQESQRATSAASFA